MSKSEFSLLHNVILVADWVDRLPWWPTCLVLGALVSHATWAWFSATHHVAWASVAGLGLALFMLLDWLMLAWLPKRERSFGPVKVSLLALALLRWILIVAPTYVLLQHVWITMAVAIIQIAITMAAWYGLWIEPFQLGVTRIEITSPRLEGRPPLRVLHLSDLHVERITRRERQLLELVDELQPDLIALTGDFLNLSYTYDERAQADCREVLARLHAPMGVYAISGSPSVDPQSVVNKLLDGLNIRRIDNQVEPLTMSSDDEPTLAIVGVACTNDASRDSETLQQVMASVPNNPATPFTLLLYHTPDLMPQAVREGVDLYLCGHTHGGQLRLPLFGALVTSSKYWKRYEMGRYVKGTTTLYVSRGIGMEGRGAPRARFLCPPEIELFELSGSEP